MITVVQVVIACAVLPPLVAVAIHVLCRGGDPQPTEPSADRCPDAIEVLDSGRLAEVWL